MQETKRRRRPLKTGHQGIEGLDNKPAVTIKTVAKHAGVSTATVSRALSGGGYVSPELHSAVTRAARELGYTSNAVAVALRSSRTSTVGVIVPEVSNPLAGNLVQDIEGFLSEVGIQLMLSCSNHDSEKEGRAIVSMIARRVDGIVIFPAPDSSIRSVMRTMGCSLPCVEVRPADGSWEVVWISSADKPKAEMLHLVQHLSGQNQLLPSHWGSIELRPPSVADHTK